MGVRTEEGYERDAGGGAVDSVFGRTGVVVAQSGDYTASEVTNDSGVAGADVAAALDTLNASSGSLNYIGARPPTVPDALDDELITAGALVGWSTWDPFPSFVRAPEVYNASLGVSLDTAFTDAAAGIYKAAPPGDFIVQARLSIPNPLRAGSKGIGVMIGEDLGAAPPTANVWSAVMQTRNNALGLDVGLRLWNDYLAPQAWIPGLDATSGPFWMRLVYNDTTKAVFAEWSRDGLNWTRNQAALVLPASPVTIGIIAYNFSFPAGDWQAYAKHFRVQRGTSDGFLPLPTEDYE